MVVSNTNSLRPRKLTFGVLHAVSLVVNETRGLDTGGLIYGRSPGETSEGSRGYTATVCKGASKNKQ